MQHNSPFKFIANFIDSKHKLFSIIGFLLLFTIFGYLAQLNQPPQSTHLWRQSDCASLALNYHQHGMSFFQPEIHNLHADGNTSGYATSECPYLYYAVGFLYKIFGHNYWVYRVVWTLIFLLGFVATYHFFLSVLQAKGIAFMGTVLVLISPVLVFYGNSFLPDVPALMFTLVGWMFFSVWYKRQQYRYLWLVALFFMLGGLLKVTALISFFALAGVWFIELLGCKLGENGKPIFSKKLKALVPFMLTFLILIAWYVWAWRYNAEHQTKYFSMRTCPIWNVSSCCNCNFSSILAQIKTLWLPHLFSTPMLVFLSTCLVLLLVFVRYANRFLATITLFSFLGTLGYTLVWFAAFHEHDYYFVNLFIFLLFMVLTSLDAMRKRFPKAFMSTYFLLFLLVFMAYGVLYTYQKQRLRYKGWMNYEHREFADLRSVAPLISDLGILQDDYVVSVPDRTPDYTLYLLNRKGWTLYNSQATDSAALAMRIKEGAKYLFVSNYEKTVGERPYLKSFISNPIGMLNGLHIFRIDGNAHPFSLAQTPSTLLQVNCSAEELDANREMLKTSNPLYFSEKVDLLSDSCARSGGKSLQVNNKQQYGFTTAIPAFPNSFMLVSVWRKRREGAGALVLSARSAGKFYQSVADAQFYEPDTGWEQLKLSVCIPSDFKPSELIVYVWNPSESNAYFDDLEILITRNDVSIISSANVQ